jgi:histidine ammonia-lyase
MHEVPIDGETLTIEDIVKVARENAKVVIPEKVKEKVKRSREVLEKLVKEKQTIYGVNTGFGALSNKTIPQKKPENYKQTSSEATQQALEKI